MNTPRSFRGNHDLTQLPAWIKNEIKANSADRQLNMNNYNRYLGILREKEREEKERREKEALQLATEFRDQAIKLQESGRKLGMGEMVAELTSPRLVSYLQYSRENRKLFLIALRKLLVELGSEQAKQIMAYLQPLQEGVGGTEKDPILARLFFKGGNAFLSGYAPTYDEKQWGGTARMAKSKRMGRTRKGKGRKESKDGKKTRRLRCWSRRNKEAQRYVVCSGSRGQKSMRYKRKLRSRKQSGGMLKNEMRALLKDELKRLQDEYERIKRCSKGGYCAEDGETRYCRHCAKAMKYELLENLSAEIEVIKDKLEN